MTKITYIPGEIANAAIDEHGNRKPVTRTQHIFDDARDKSQAEVNADIDNTLALHQSEINALNNQNYVTVDSFNALPATGEADTIYRVSNWDGTQQDPTVYSEYAWNGSQYIHLSTKTQIGEVFDISAYHATGGELAKYADLTAALGTNGSNVPQSLRKGGMSVKFVQSSDNKYVQYRLMADEWSTNTDDWAIADEGVYVENPEFVYVKTDTEDKILYGVKKDGDFYFGAGIPSQIQEELDDLADLAVLVENKVDKEEGKSLINSEYASTKSIIESPEYIQVTTDSEGKVICGIKADGSVYIPILENESLTKQLEEAKAEFEIKAQEIEDNIDAKIELYDEVFSYFQALSNPEYIQVTTDSEGKILEAFKNDGTKKIDVDIDFKGMLLSKTDSPEWIKATTDSNGTIIYGIKSDGNFYVANTNILKAIQKNQDDIQSFLNPKTADTKKTYYDETKCFAVTIKNKVAPYHYIVNHFYDKVLTYPDGTIFYAGPEGNTIKRILPNGTTSTLLTLEGASGAYQGVWMDSNNNIFVSPSFSSNEETRTGIWKLPFGEDTFVQVLSLYNPQSDVPSESTPNRNRVWTWTEDREGNLYAGVYGNPFCPYIYKSTDGGDSWFFLTDMSEFVPGGIHIHFIEYNRYDDCLYCTVGEVNKLLKSADGGVTWTDLNVRLDPMKSCSICIVDDGIVLGSDYGYYGMLYKVYPDGSYRTTTKFWANAIFAIRQSDVTGWLYAIGVIDAAVLSTDWYPPIEALSDTTVLQNWISSNPQHLTEWQKYHNDMLSVYPDDAIRPQHTAVLISRDKGETWEILYRHPYQARGYISYFRNGEAACCFDDSKTLIISEGRHQYTETGIDCSKNILYKLN